MSFWIVRRHYGISAIKFTNIERGTETPNYFMPEPQIEGRRTPSWDYGMMKAVGVRIKTLS